MLATVEEPDHLRAQPHWYADLAGRVWRYRALLLTAAALAPLVVLLVKIPIDGGYANWGDNALIEMQVRDVGRAPVLLGPYSRFGFAHPGPLMFYLLAIPYWLTGGAASGLNLGSLLINGAAIAGIAWIAWRRGGPVLLGATLLVLELFLWQLGADFLRQPWNPYVTLLPFLLLMFVAWELARGERWALPVGAAVATFVVQSHMGYLPVVAALGVTALLLGRRALVRPSKAEESGPALSKLLLITAGVLLVLWLPPLVEMLTASPSNPVKIARFQLREGGAQHSWSDGVALVARYSGNLPAFLSGRQLGLDGTASGSGWMALPIVATFSVCGLVAVRKRAGDAVRFGFLVAVLTAAAVISVTRINGPLFEYLTRWTQVAGLTMCVFPFVVASDPKLRRLAPRLRRAATAVIVCLVVLVAGVNAVRAIRAEPPGGPQALEVAALTTAVRNAIPPGEPTIVIGEGGPASRADEFGVATELLRDGYAVRFPESYRNEVGSRRVAKPEGAVVSVIFGTEADRPRLSALAGAEELGSANGIVVFRVNPKALDAAR